MHGKLLLSEVPIYRVNTLRNCFCDAFSSPHPCRLLSGVGLEAGSPGEVALLQGPLQPPPSFVAGAEGEGRRLQDSRPGGGRLAMGQRRVLKAERAGPVSAEVCASVLARACQSAAGEVVAAIGGRLAAPAPLPGRVA